MRTGFLGRAKPSPWGKRLSVAGAVAGAVAGGALFLGAGTLVARAVRKRVQPPMDVHARYAEQFRLAHEALRRNARHFDVLIAKGAAERAPEPFGELIELYAQFLVAHHESEDHALFPTLRRSSALRTTDAAHLDTWTREHRALNTAATALERAGGAMRRGDGTAIAEIERLVYELEDLLDPHLAGEEQIINAQRLREMLPAKAIMDIESQSRKSGARSPMMAMFFLHSLSPDEQRVVFGPAPWMFRNVVMPFLDAAKFRPLRSVALEPATAV
jgi:hemerythrin-like domain-containing protein